MEEAKDTKLCKTCVEGKTCCGEKMCEGKSCCGGKMCCGHKRSAGGMGGGAYGLAFIGALVYFMQNVSTFSGGVMALLKAIVWPAILVYKLLVFIVA